MIAIYLTTKHVYHARTKHIDVRFHFIRKIIDEGDIELKKIYTKENLVDMLIKLVTGVKFAHYKKLLHIIQVA